MLRPTYAHPPPPPARAPRHRANRDAQRRRSPARTARVPRRARPAPPPPGASRAAPEHNRGSARDAVYAWNLELRALSARADLGGVLSALSAMRARGVRADAYSYATAVACARRARAPAAAEALLARMDADGVAADEHVLAGVVGALGRADPPRLDAARAAFLRARRPGRVLCNVYLDALARAGAVGAVRAVQAGMAARGVAPDGYTAAAVVSAFVAAGRAGDAAAELRAFVAAGARPPPPAWHALAGLHARAGDAAAAAAVLNEMAAAGVRPTAVSFNILIGAYATGLRGDVALAFGALECMMLREGLRPDRYTFHALMKVCVAGGAPRDALAVYGALKASRFAPNQVSFRLALHAAAAARDRSAVADVAADMRARPGPPAQETAAALVAAAAWCGNLRAAAKHAREAVRRAGPAEADALFAQVGRKLESLSPAGKQCAEQVVPQLRRDCAEAGPREGQLAAV